MWRFRCSTSLTCTVRGKFVSVPTGCTKIFSLLASCSGGSFSIKPFFDKGRKCFAERRFEFLQSRRRQLAHHGNACIAARVLRRRLRRAFC